MVWIKRPPSNPSFVIPQAVLDPAAEDGARVWLRCKVQDGPPLAVAALRCGGSEAQALDLILDQYSEFTVEGPAPVHVTGARSPPAHMSLLGRAQSDCVLAEERTGVRFWIGVNV